MATLGGDVTDEAKKQFKEKAKKIGITPSKLINQFINSFNNSSNSSNNMPKMEIETEEEEEEVKIPVKKITNISKDSESNIMSEEQMRKIVQEEFQNNKNTDSEKNQYGEKIKNDTIEGILNHKHENCSNSENCGVCKMNAANYRRGVISGIKLQRKYPKMNWNTSEIERYS